MTIVCATHFTDSSLAAVNVAADLARLRGQKLWLVNVVPKGLAEPSETAQQAAIEALRVHAAALADSGLLVETATLFGPLDRAVGKFCADVQARLLVVGDSQHKVSPMFAGPLDKLAYGVEVPLLVVRDPKPFKAWAAGKAPLKVLLALDHSWSSGVARDWIVRLAQYGRLEVVAAHIWWPLEEYQRRGLPVPSDDEGHAALSKAMRAETAEALAGLPPNVKHRVHLEMSLGHVGEQLMAMAVAEQVDVFVLGTHPHHGPLARRWAVSHQVLADAPMSVACIPGRIVFAEVSSSSAVTALKPSPEGDVVHR